RGDRAAVHRGTTYRAHARPRAAQAPDDYAWMLRPLAAARAAAAGDLRAPRARRAGTAVHVVPVVQPAVAARRQGAGRSTTAAGRARALRPLQHLRRMRTRVLGRLALEAATCARRRAPARRLMRVGRPPQEAARGSPPPAAQARCRATR